MVHNLYVFSTDISYFFAKLSALVNSFSDIGEEKSFISKMANLYLFISGILRNHSITLLVSFHWLILRESRSWWFILSRMFLLIHSTYFIFRRVDQPYFVVVFKVVFNVVSKVAFRQHKLHKIFNKNSVKVSYSCTK